MRVLCFGDSLTEGYTLQESGEFHPYSTAFRKLLEEHCKVPVVVDTAGVSGESVIPSMTLRLDDLLNEASEPYDWVIILGGTNDLGRGTKSGDLLPHLLGLHDRAKKSGAKTLALALPQYLYELSPGNESYRAEKANINDGLKEYSDKSAGSTVYVDLWNGLPFCKLPTEEKALYWVDGLHMTPRGYDKMAGVIFDCLQQHI